MNSLKLHSLKVPWDKISNIVEPLHGLEPPTKDIKWKFDIDFCNIYVSVSDEVESVMEYLLNPYINETNNQNQNSSRSYDDSDGHYNNLINLAKDDNGLQTTVGDEYIYIETLKEASLILKLTLIRNTKLYSEWETISSTGNQEVKTFSLRQSLFIQIAKIDIIIWLFSKKTNHERKTTSRTKSYQDFETLSEYGILPKINYTSQSKIDSEKDSLWMKITNNPIETINTPNYPSNNILSHLMTNYNSRLPNTILLHQKKTQHDTSYKGEFAKINQNLEYPKPISMYSQFDLEEAFRLLLYRWKSINYHLELLEYTKLLLLRGFCIIVFGGRSEKIGHDCSSIIFDANYIPGDYIYRMTIRYYYIIEKIFKFECLRNLCKFDKLTISPTFEQEHSIITKKLQSICLIWSKSEISKFYSDSIRKRHLELQVPPGDDEWLKYISPFEAITVNNILEKLHETAYGIISENSNKSLEEIIVTKPIYISKLHDELIITIINLFFADHEEFSFKDEFVFDEIKEGKLINRQSKLDKPFLAVLFSKFLVHFQDDPEYMEIYNVKKSVLLEIDNNNDMVGYNDLILKAIINDNTIYEAIATLLLILNINYPDLDNVKYMYQKISSYKPD